MAVLLPLLLYLPYLVIRLLFNLLRNVIWTVNGTQAAILKNRGSYETSAHVLKIIGRFRFDQIMTTNNLVDFVMIHDGFEHPNYVLKKEVTLYYLDDEEAVFVECQEGDSPWNMKDYCFSRIGQYRKAIRVIILPTDVAYKLVDTIGPPKGDLIFIHNMARCGSTLLCNIFHETGQYVSYSEPSVLNDLVAVAGQHTYPYIAKRMTATISLLCKQSTDNDVRGHVIKPMVTSSEVLTSLYELFPHGTYMFLYRDFKPTARSMYRLYRTLPFIVLVVLLNASSPTICQCVSAFYGTRRFNGRIYPFGAKTPYAKISFSLLLAHVTYQRWRNEGKQFIAVKYEDLTSDPNGSLGIIFDYCGTPKELIPLALHAMNQDSQENSAISQKRLSVVKSPEFTEDDVTEIRNMCAKISLWDVFDTSVLPGTITLSGLAQT